MITVGQFEKVSFEQFYKDVMDTFDYFQYEDIMDIYNNLKLPCRATTGSAGHDFKSPIPFVLKAGKTIKIPTGIRVKVDDGWFLACYPRSGLGFKYQVRLWNTVGIIDSDYFYSDNEGHIMLKLFNGSPENKPLEIKQGDGIAQGIFQQYGITYDDDVSDIRNGGMGSTGK